MSAAKLLAIGAAAGGLLYLAWKAQQQASAASFDIGSLGIGASVSSAVNTATETILGAIGMRGIRNNNPGNIRHSATRWQGQSATQTDSAFVQFDSAEYGIRALAVLLGTYSTRYGLNTVRGIISRWAPASENNTAAYINSVAGALGVSPDEQINVQARKAELVKAIIKHENGINPYSVATIDAGVALA